MFPGDFIESSFPSANLLGLRYDHTPLARQCARSFLFQSALSVCSFGGTAIYFVKEKMTDLPQSVREMPFPDIASLKRLKIVYKATTRELARVLADMSQKPTTLGLPVLFCVEDLTTYCEAAARKRSWTTRRAFVALLAQFEEALKFADTHKTPFRIVFSVRAEEEHLSLIRHAGSQICLLSVVAVSEEEVTVGTAVPSSVPCYSFRFHEDGISIKRH